MVIVLVLIGGPPDRILGVLVHNDKLVFRGTSRIDSRHHVDGIQFGHLSLFKALKTRLGLLFKEQLKRRIVYDFCCPGNAILA